LFFCRIYSAFSVQGDPVFANPLGRGGHQMLTVVEKDGDSYLWVVGGRGGDNSVNGGDEVHIFLACAWEVDVLLVWIPVF
jgi:hypothetical protein